MGFLEYFRKGEDKESAGLAKDRLKVKYRWLEQTMSKGSFYYGDPDHTLLTDGVFEAEDIHGQMFEEEPVAQIIRETDHLPCAGVAQEILDRVDAHLGGKAQADDITIVLIRRNE